MRRMISAALLLIILCTGLLPLLSGCQHRKDLLEAESVSLKKTLLSDFGISSVRAVDFADGKFVVLSDAGLTVLDPSDPPSASRPEPLPEGTVGMKIRGGFIYLLSENRLSVRSYKDFSLGTAEREYEIPEIPEGFRVFKLDVCETYALISLRSVRLNDRGRYFIGNMFVCIDLSEGEAQILSDMSDFEFRAGTVREKDILLLSGTSGQNSGNIYPYEGKISLAVCRLTDAAEAFVRKRGEDPFRDLRIFVAKDKSEALVTVITVNLTVNGPQEYIKCKGLAPDRYYRVEGGSAEHVATGMALMHAGIPIPREIPEFTAFIYHLVAV